MGRKKVPIEKIENKSGRWVTFNKRRKGLIKKALQLNVFTEAHIAIIVIHPPVESNKKCDNDGKIKMTLFQGHSRLEDVLIKYLLYEIQKDKDEKKKASDDRDKSRIVINDKEALIHQLELIKIEDDRYKPPPAPGEPILENGKGSSSSVISSEHSMPSQPDWDMRNLLMNTHDRFEFLNLVMGLCQVYKDTPIKDPFLLKICQVRLKNCLAEIDLQKQMLVARTQQTCKIEPPFDSLNLQLQPHQLQQVQQLQQHQQQHQLHQQQQQQQHQTLLQHFFPREHQPSVKALHEARKVEEVVMDGNPSSSMTHMRQSQMASQYDDYNRQRVGRDGAHYQAHVQAPVAPQNEGSGVTGHNGILKMNFYTGAGYGHHHQDLIQPPLLSDRGEASTSKMILGSTGFNRTTNITRQRSYVHQVPDNEHIHRQDLIQLPSASGRAEASTSRIFPASTCFNPTTNITRQNSYTHLVLDNEYVHHQNQIQPPSARDRGERLASRMFPASTSFNPTTNISRQNSYIREQNFGEYGDGMENFCNNGPH